MSKAKLSFRLTCLAALAIPLGYAALSRDAQLASSHGSGSASFRIWGTASAPLFPGAPAVPVELGFTNPNTFPITVADVRVEVGATSSPACAASNFAANRQLAVPVRVPAGATKSLSQLGVPSSDWPQLAMIDSGAGQDACKHASVQLSYTGTASGDEPADTPVGVASGPVFVNGLLFRHGAIAYGAEVLIKPGGVLRLETKSGTVTVYPPPGQSIHFVVRRVFIASPHRRKGAALGSAAKPRPYTELRLRGGLAGCPANGLARNLWAEGRGRLRVRGSFAISMSHGTGYARWLTQDRCNRTVVRVAKRTVHVSGITRPGTTLVTAGHSFQVSAQDRIAMRQSRGAR